MLEDPAYNSVVRWGNDGESFVVLEVRFLLLDPLPAWAGPGLNDVMSNLFLFSAIE